METTTTPTGMSCEAAAWEHAKADAYNKTRGRLGQLECPLCFNKGTIAYVGENGFMRVKPCGCRERRKTMQRARQTGAAALLGRYTFGSFTTAQPWQAVLLQAARDYAAAGTSGWFFIGGQSGAGKTHLCTAILGAAVKRGVAARYCIWPQEMRQLTGAGFAGFTETNKRLDELCCAPLLYIDDLFKSDDNAPPDKRQSELAFEVLNSRYNRMLPTIVSSERSYLELKSLNNAIAGRIRERCGRFEFSIKKESGKDWRAQTSAAKQADTPAEKGAL